MTFDILTLFPEAVEAMLGISIIGRARVPYHVPPRRFAVRQAHLRYLHAEDGALKHRVRVLRHLRECLFPLVHVLPLFLPARFAASVSVPAGLAASVAARACYALPRARFPFSGVRRFFFSILAPRAAARQPPLPLFPQNFGDDGLLLQKVGKLATIKKNGSRQRRTNE